MPRLIQRDDLSVSRGENRQLIRAPSSGLGRALAGFAGSVNQVGNIAGTIADDQYEKDKAVDLAKARSAFQIGMLDARAKYSYDKDTDQDTWAPRFADDAKTAHESAGELIRDPALKQRFLIDTAPEVERNRLDVDDSATVIRQKRQVQESDNALDAALEKAGSDDVPDANKDAILNDTVASINGLVKNHVITPEMGSARIIKATRDFANRRALSDKEKDPSKALRWLRGEAAAGPDVSDLRVTNPDHSQWGKRPDGSAKGEGFLGVLKRPDGTVSSEISISTDAIGGKDFPLLVPTLTRAEVDKILAIKVDDPKFFQKLPRGAIKKAAAFAEKRVAAGKSPFAGAGETGASSNAADDFISGNESFIPTPQLDGPPENRVWRVGYGSDTITTEDGKKVTVTPGMRVTRADADRDLARRRKETQEGIIFDIHPEAWEALSEGSKTALTDMAYNYGSLPKDVAAAARAGDVARLAAVVRGHAGDKGNGEPGRNAQRRYKEAAMIESGKGGEARPGYYEFLSQEAKLTLINSAEADIANQDQAVATQARQAEADARAAAQQRKGEIDLGIEQGQVSREAILNETAIDDGDKAELIRKWESHEADNISAAEVWDAISRGAPLPDKSEKGLDQLFKAGGGGEALVKGDPKAVATVQTLWDKGQAMPPAAKSALEGMIQSDKPQRVIAGLSILDQLQRSNPPAFDTTFGAPTSKALLYYQDHIGDDPATIVDGIRKASDPQTIKARQPLIDMALKQLRDDNVTAETIAAKFDPNTYWFGKPGVATGTYKTPGGVRAIQDKGLLERDYARAYSEAYADDPDNAEKNAMTMVGRTWGVSEINGGNLMRFPPERYNPVLDGKWMKKDLEADLMKLGYAYQPSSGVTGMKLPEMVRPYILQPIPMTESDVSSGQPPHYAVVVQNPNTGEWDAVLDKDGAMLAYQFDSEPHMQQQRQKFLKHEGQDEKRREGVRELGKYQQEMTAPPIEELQ